MRSSVPNISSMFEVCQARICRIRLESRHTRTDVCRDALEPDTVSISDTPSRASDIRRRDAPHEGARRGADDRRTGRETPQTRRRKSLSDKQLAILEVIQRSVARRGYPPSMREIGDAVGLSSLSSVTHQLNQLELSGYLRRDPQRPRAHGGAHRPARHVDREPGRHRDPGRRRGDGAARRPHRRRHPDHRRPAGRGGLPAPPPARRQGRPVHAQGRRRVDDRRRDLRRRLGRRARSRTTPRTARSSRRCSTARPP